MIFFAEATHVHIHARILKLTQNPPQDTSEHIANNFFKKYLHMIIIAMPTTVYATDRIPGNCVSLR